MAVGAAVTQLLSDTSLWQALDTTVSTLISELLGDNVVQQALDTAIAAQVSALLGGGDLGQVVGAQVATALVGLIADPTVITALTGLVDTVAQDFFGATGVIPALSDAAGQLAAAAVAGDLASVLPAVLSALRTNPDIDAAVGMTVTDAVTQLFSDTTVWQLVGATLTTLTTGLLDNTVVQQYAGTEVATLVTGFLGDSPIAVPVGQAVGAAVQQFLAIPGIGSAVGAIIGSVLPEFLGQAGVPSALGDVGGQLVAAVLAGADLATALAAAEAELLANSAIQTALKTTIADTLNLVDSTMLSNAAFQQALGTIVTTLIETLAGSPAVRTYLGDELGPTLGPAVVNLLADSTFVDDVAVTFGSVLTNLLAYPGFNGSVIGALNQIADAVVDGTDPATAIQEGLAALEANPDYQAAINAIVPKAVNSLLNTAAVRQAVGAAVRTIVIDALKGAGINNGFIDGIAGQVAGVSVETFLAKPTAEALFDRVTLDVLTGMPLSEVTDAVIQAVLRDPGLQVALGTSIGTGIGSLFGDNIIGLLVGGVAGFTATIVIAVASGLTRLFTAGDPAVGAAAASGGPAVSSHFFPLLPAPGDLYVMSAVVPEQQGVSALGAASEGELVLTLTAITGPDQTQPDVLDLQMAIDEAEVGKLRVGFRFALDQLLAVPAPASRAEEAVKVS